MPCLRHFINPAAKPTIMFIESRPVTGFGETAGWALPLMPQEPVPRARLRRPPMLTANSPSPSLAGMEQTIPPTLKQPPLTTNEPLKSSLQGYEQTIPPFQDFVKRTPPLEESKPLPPTPLRVRGSSFGGTTNSSSREPSPPAPRRTSSVYSRAVSQWLAESPTWSASDLEDDPIPALPLEYLQPIAYSASSPQLKETTPTGPFLQPRTYQPLLTTPSPTISRCTTPSPPRASLRRDLRISVLLPTAVDVAPIPRTHLRTVSLEKAKATSSAPGAEHLLPEELRAKSKGTPIRKARTLESIVKPPGPAMRDTLAMFGRSVELPPDAPGLPSMTLIDAEGRDRVVGSPRFSVAPLPTFAFPLEPILSPSHTVNAFPVGKHPPRTMVSLTAQNQQDTPPYTLEREQAQPDRDRTIQRGSRISSYNRYQHDRRRRQSSSSVEAAIDAQQMANDYHSMLDEHYRRASASSASRSVASDSVTSDAEVGTHMQMVPQPLFNGKLSTIQDRKRYDSGNTYISPFHFHHRQQSDSNLLMRSQTSGSGSGYDCFPSPPRPGRPPQLSTTGATHRRRSSMDMIPISSPFQYSFSPTIATTTMPPMPPVPQPRNIPPQRRNSDDNRESAYWHIPTKNGNELLFRRSKDKKPSIPTSPKSPRLPLLGADIIAQRLQTQAATPEHSPRIQEPWSVQQQQYQQQYQPDLSRTTSVPSPTPSHSSRRRNSPHSNSREERRPEKELTAKQALFSRITKSAAKYADKLTRPASYDSQSHAATKEEEERGRSTTARDHEHDQITFANLHTLTNPVVARKEAPHLLRPTAAATTTTSPNRKQRPSHALRPSLGWSSAAKTAFDEQQEHIFLLQQYGHHEVGQDQYLPQQQSQHQYQNPQQSQSQPQQPRTQTPQPQPQPQTQTQTQTQTRDTKTPNKQTIYTHTITPARPLDGRSVGSGSGNTWNYQAEDESNNGNGNGRNDGGGLDSSSNKGGSSSLFSSFRSEARREAKAEKRRREIKRSIRVVGVMDAGGGGGGG